MEFVAKGRNPDSNENLNVSNGFWFRISFLLFIYFQELHLEIQELEKVCIF